MDFFTFYYMGNELAMAIKHYPIPIPLLLIIQWQKLRIFGLFAANEVVAFEKEPLNIIVT